MATKTSYGTSYTYKGLDGRTYTATPRVDTTAAQKSAVASNSGYTAVGGGGSSNIQPQVNALGRSGGGNSSPLPRAGTTGNATASQVITPARAGTTGNPAGTSSPVGSGTNIKAVQTASAIGIVPKKQTASVFDAYLAASQNRVNKDMQVSGLDTARGNNIPSSHYNLMTRSDGSNFPNNPVPKIDYQSLIKNSAPIGNSQNFSDNTNNSASAINALQRTSPQSQVITSTTPPSTPVPVSNRATLSYDNTRNTSVLDKSQEFTQATDTARNTPVLDKSQEFTQATDTARNELEVSKNATNQATTEDDRKYYSKKEITAEARYQEAIKNEQSYMALSEEEKAQQKLLDDEQSRLAMDTVNVANQPISTGFITGQSKALESASLARQGKIQRDLSRFQQDRMGKLNVSRTTTQAARDAANRTSSNFESYTSEQRKRKQQLDDATRKRSYNVEDRNYKTANPTKNIPKTTTPSGVKPNTYKNAQQIPESIRNDVLDDIVINQGNLSDIITAYPEISASAIKAMFNQFSMQGTGINNTSKRPR